MKIKEIPLKPETINYILSALECGNEISEYIRSILPQKKTKVFAIVPEDIGQEHLYSFDRGGLESVPFDYIINYYSNLLNANPLSILLLEEHKAKKSDYYIRKKLKLKNYFTFEEHIFFYIDGRLDIESFRETIGTASRYPSIIYNVEVSEYQREKIRKNEILKEDLLAMADSVTDIFIGAYDEESYLRVKIEE